MVSDPATILEGPNVIHMGMQYLFAPVTALTYSPIIDKFTYFNERPHCHPKSVGFSACPFEGFFGGESVVYSMLQMAVRLGAKKILMTGFDNKYNLRRDPETGELFSIPGEQSHFIPNYIKDTDILAEPRLHNVHYQYQVAKAECDRRNISITNITNGGELDVFPRQSIDEFVP